MLIKKSSRKREKISKKGFVFDYKMPSKDVGIAIQKLNGRVPDKGWTRNKICNEICYVIKGSGTVFIDKEKHKIKTGDIFIIKPKQKSYIIAENLEFLTITSPDWYSEQCEISE